GYSQFAGGPTQLHAGLMARVESFTFGFDVHNLNTANPEWGAGLRYDFERLVALVVDTSFNPTLGQSQLQPSLMIGDGAVAFSLSYGVGTGSAQLSTGVAGGVSLKID